jgi:hypothetical protein
MAASLKVSELTALASVASADLFLVADADVSISKKVTLTNVEGSISLANLGTKSIDNLSDVDVTTAAPNTGEALAWDGSNFIPTAAHFTLAGVSAGDTNLGTFTGDIITDNTTIKTAFQDLETKIEANDQAAATASSVTEIDGNVNDLILVSGLAENSQNLGTFSGSTIADDQTVKVALQALETSLETKESQVTVAEINSNADDLISLTGVAENTVNLGTFSGSTIDNSVTIKAALQALESAIEAEAAARGSAISDLIDGAPDALDTLNELAAALNDDSSAASTLTGLINANETHIDNMATLTGVAKDAVNLGTFSGSTIPDSRTVKAALQEVETAFEEVDTNANDLISLSGLAENTTVFSPTGGDADFTGTTLAGTDLTVKSALQALGTKADANAAANTAEASARADADTTLTTNVGTLQTHTGNQESTLGVAATTTHLGTFSGSTINDNVNVKQALQALETACELSTDDGDNVNQLVGNTSADAEPANYFFLVVDASTGAIKAVNKEFVETEGSN